MTDRLATHLEASALLRRAEALGGSGTVVAKGDAERGELVILVAERGRTQAVLERSLGADGSYGWRRGGPAEADEARIGQYVVGRRRNDPDLWVIELDIVPSARFIDETIASA